MRKNTRKNTLIAGIAVAALLPSFAMAQVKTCEQQRNERVTGTVVGAGLGAILGGAVAGKDDRTKGAVIGGLGGALLGNQVSKGKGDCAHAYGYYDANGMWHANAVDRTVASGYFDRNGNWVDGQPNGHYDSSGNWVSASTSLAAAGYYDRQGRWVPASASGYYDANGNWVAGSASGYYSNGRWIPGPATGRYDASGRWISGQPAGHRDANGVWVADAQPGYWDNGRWRAGPAYGYYDANGRWVTTAPAAGGYGSNASYGTSDRWSQAPNGVRARLDWLEQRIRRAADNGRLSRREVDDAMMTLNDIRRQEARAPHRRGMLNARDEARLQDRLDALRDQIRIDVRDRG